MPSTTEPKKVLIYLDTEKHANPFDILIAVDAGYDFVFPYSGVSENDCGLITENAVFARSPAGLKNTVILIGGDLDESLKIFEMSKEDMFPPFEVSLVWDPQGACTTAAAAVARIESLAGGQGSLKGKKVVVLAGTGPIGRIALRIFKSLGAQTVLTSRTMDRAKEISRESGAKACIGSMAMERADACKRADVILSTGAMGVNLLSKEQLSAISPIIAADTNAVEPFGIEGVGFGTKPITVGSTKLVGPLAIGDLKNKTERNLLARALETHGFYSYMEAFELARELAKK